MKAKKSTLALLVFAALVLVVSPALAETEDTGATMPKKKVVMETSITDYTISSGDTLWDISASFYGDPWLWPTIWELNPYIADPHWIYPDNKLKVKIIEGMEYVWKSGKVPDFLAPADWWDPSFYYKTQSNRVDFLSKAKFEQAGEIVDHIDDLLLLGQHDTVFFTMPEETNVQLGDTFTVFRMREKVKHPKKGGSLGYVVDLLGEIETVNSTTLKNGRVVYTGDITFSMAEMSVEDRVVMMPREPYIVTLNKTSLDLKGSVVAFEPGRSFFGQQDIVFIDLGLKDGLEIGNSFSIWRESKNKKRLPGYFVGNLLVIHVEPSTATALVTNSLRELFVGDEIQSDIE